MTSKLISYLAAAACFVGAANMSAQELNDSRVKDKYSKENIEHIDYETINFNHYFIKPMPEDVRKNIFDIIVTQFIPNWSN